MMPSARLLLAIALALLLPACAKKAKLTGVHPARTDVEATVTTISSGTVDAEQQAVLGFGVTGRVQKIAVRLGDSVRTGDLIAQLDNADLRVIFADATKELRRVQQLFAEKLVSRVALDEAKKAVEVAKANLERSILVAPFNGIVTELNLRLGELGGPQTAKVPVRLVDQRPRLVKGDIDEIDLAKVRPGQTARVRIPAARPEAFAGEVTRVVPYVDTTKDQDRTSQIELRLPASDKIVPVGASAEIEIVIGRKTGVLALPARTILGAGKNRYVFRFHDGKIEKREVTLGMGNYERTEVLSGISEGDTVVFPTDEVELVPGLRATVEVGKWP